jgi:hypothetical protein
LSHLEVLQAASKEVGEEDDAENGVHHRQDGVDDLSCTTNKSPRLTIDRIDRIPMKISYPMPFSSLRTLVM